MELDLSFWIGLILGAVLVAVILAIVGTATARRGRQALLDRDSYNRQLGAELARRDAQNLAAKVAPTSRPVPVPGPPPSRAARPMEVTRRTGWSGHG